jgi:hypothetical protein
MIYTKCYNPVLRKEIDEKAKTKRYPYPIPRKPSF